MHALLALTLVGHTGAPGLQQNVNLMLLFRLWCLAASLLPLCIHPLPPELRSSYHAINLGNLVQWQLASAILCSNKEDSERPKIGVGAFIWAEVGICQG
jgi:hypothetical protein